MLKRLLSSVKSCLARLNSDWRRSALALCLVLLNINVAQAVTLTAATLTATTPTQTAQSIIYVRPGETFSVDLTGNTQGSNTNWQGTGWFVSTTAGNTSSYNCANTVDYNTNNSSTPFTVTFMATAPATAGTYNIYFYADSSGTCTGTKSSVVYLPNAVVVDGTAPVATLACNSPASCGSANPTSSSSVQWTVTFDKAVTGVAASNFGLTTSGVSGASVTGVTGSGTVYTVTANTGSGNGTIALNLNASLTNIIDHAGNNPAAVNGAAANTYTIDKTAPTATIACGVPSVCDTGNPTKLAQVQWTVTFSEPVTGVSASGFTLSGTGASGASINSVTASGNVYTVTATTGVSGVLTLNVAGSPIVDAAGNSFAGTSGVSSNSYTIDKTAPTAVISCYTPSLCGTGSPTNATSVTWMVTFSENVGLVVANNFTLSGTGLSGASISSVSGSGTTWYVTANTGASGTLAVNLSNATGISDTAGNLATTVSATASNTYTVDKIAPTATIACSNPASCGTANPTTNTQVVWAVTFSESVTGLTTSNFGFSGTAASGASIVSVTGSGTSWQVTANATIDGTLGLNLSYNISSVIDSANNALASTVTATAANTYKISHVPSATITCSSPASCGAAVPTSSATFTWLVTFSESVTGVSLTNFTLSGTGINNASLSSVSGSGTSWTVTANSGDNGTLGLNMNANLTSILDTDNLSPAAVTAVASNTYTKDSSASGECFTDNFTRASLGSDWATTSSSGTFGQPRIVSNRLRLTDSSTTVATAAHLQRIFPAAGNKIVVEFDYYSYNGNGADGMGFTLSDANVAPVAGAFGGSLGYAQKSNPGSDCTTTGGCPGFAGGWIGVGFDEFGNFSAATEGRSGGTTVLADTVVVRGSGSGQSGYTYHTRSAALSPGIDATGTTAAPGHRYRVTVDHTDGVHAFVSVDRDTTVGHTGYTNIIPAYDAKAMSGQAAVPSNWYLSYTGSTGANYNTHEIGALQVCTTRPIAVPTLHHVRVIHDGSALTCAAENITLRACADATCSALYLGSVTADLTTTGGTWSADPVTFTGGQTVVTLSKTTTGSATLGGTVTSPSATLSVLQCYNVTTSGDCVLPFSAASCAFDAVESGKNPSTPIYTKLAGTSFNIDVLALTAGAINTSSTASITPVLVDQNSTRDANGCGTTVLAATVTPATYTLTGSNLGRKTFAFNYSNAAADVRVKITSGATTACSSDNFSIRPTTFSVASNNATNTSNTGSPVFVAGKTDLGLYATPFNSAAANTNAYSGTVNINNNRLAGHTNAVTAGVVTGTFTGGQTISGNWAMAGSSFAYSEVGNFKFQTYGVYDNSFVSVDMKQGASECFSDNYLGTATAPQNPNVLDANGMYGCYFGNTADSNYIGRFMPDHFDTVISQSGGVPMACPAGQTCPTAFNGAVYSKQPFSMQVIAKRYGAGTPSTDGVVTNYNYNATPANSYSKAVTVSAWSALGSTVLQNPPSTPSGSSLTTTAVAANSFTSGIATIAAQAYTLGVAGFSSSAPNASANWAVPTSIYLRAVENAGGDGVTSLRSTPSSSIEAGVLVVLGRLDVSHAYGSELLRLRIPVLAQYWNGTRWVTSYFDSVSTFATSNLAALTCVNSPKASVALNCSNASAVVAQGATALVNGAGQFFLAAQGANRNGTIDLSFTAPTWLPSTIGRVKIGTFRSPLIYIRELY